MSPIALHQNPDLRDDLAPPADATHPPAGVVAFGDLPLLLVRGVPWLFLIAAAALGALDRGLTQRWDTIPFLVSFLFFGMPHGAMDWVVDGRLRDASSRLPRFTWYLAWMTLAGVALALMPVPTVIAFFVLTVLHWGLGDLEATAPGTSGRFLRTMAISGRGLLVLGVAFAVSPVASWAPFSLLVGGGPDPTAIGGAARVAGIVAFACGGLATSVWIVHRWRTGDRRAAILDGLEAGLVVAAIALTDPLFGIGVYFLGTHSLRHALRLASTPEVLPAGLSGASLLKRLSWVHLLSIPLLLPTLVMLLVWCRLQFGALGPDDLTATMLGFFLVTTLPHHILGLRLPVRGASRDSDGICDRPRPRVQ